jgi:hypothetical protein
MVSVLPAAAEDLPSWDTYPAVYETDQWSLDWSPIHGLRVEVHRIIRVNRSSGSDVGRIRIWDTFFQRLKDFEGEVRDTTGQRLFSVDLEDVQSIAPFLQFRLYSGDVVRSVDLVAPQTPYIIEVRWTVEIDNPFFWPDWILADSYPRRHAVYRVAIRKDREIHYRHAHAGLTRSRDRTARRHVATWELRDWTPPNRETGVPDRTYPLLHVAPAEFRFGGNKGLTESWNTLGEWYWALTSDRLDLTEDQEQDVDRHLQDYLGERTRAAALKDWISSSWRYVAIEVGVGGWRPHYAHEVFVNRYGDCKDVVFLWVAMMRHAGMEAYPALIRARDPLPIDPDFPKDWFDHVVGVAMINGDTLWADPSDPRYPLGTLPRRCESRWALLVGDFGGRLIRTPSSDAHDNWLVTHSEGSLTTDGDLEFQCRVTASGHFARHMPMHSEFDNTAAIAAILGIAPPAVAGEVDGFQVVGSDTITVDLHGSILGWAIAEPDRIQIQPRLAGWAALDTLAGRVDPAQIDFPAMVYDTLIIHFPDGWLPELWPATPFHSETAGEMGDVRSFEDGTLTILRHLRWGASGRSATDLTAVARLRQAYRDALTSDWLFRPVEIRTPPDDSSSASPIEVPGDSVE